MCQNNIEEIAQQLEDLQVLGQQWSIVYARTGGRCEYCHRDLIADRFGYACAQIDHLLPQSLYPEVADNPLNWVLACHLCNSSKGVHDVLEDCADTPQVALATNRTGLIQMAWAYIHGRLLGVHDPLWEKAKRILLDHSWV